MSTARTSITMNSGVLNRLRLFSRVSNKTVSQIIEEAVVAKLEEQKSKHAQKIYNEIEKLQHSFKDVPENPQYKGMSVDDILYGEHGAWNTKQSGEK